VNRSSLIYKEGRQVRLNFLAHDVVLPSEAPAVLRVAAAVPDLWSQLPKRPLPVVIREATGASQDPAVRAVGAGVRAHLRADATFHRHPTFVGWLQTFERELEALWPSLGSLELGAHLLIEMLLDRSLMSRDPTLVDNYYRSFAPAHIEFVSLHATTVPESRVALIKVLNAFTDSRFLADYLRPELLVLRFTRRLGSLRFARAVDPPTDALVERIPAWSTILEKDTPQLLDVVRQAVRQVLESG
jgi:hypothetical protein